MNFETISCPACGSDLSQCELDVRDRFHTASDPVYHIVRCCRCGLLYLNPRPDARSIAAAYNTAGYDPFLSGAAGFSLKNALYRSVRRVTIRRKAARVVQGLAPGAATLDVGCATGEFLVELRRRGFRPVGVEPDPGAADFARRRQGLTVWTGGVEQVPAGVGPFELISLWHVLEHVHDLGGTLARLRELLSPTGRIALAVPNPQSLDAGLYGARWVGWDAPRHLYHFEPEVLLALLERAGFRAERGGAVAFDAFYHSLLSESALPGGILRAAWRGGRSFLRGLRGRGGSSELYFAFRS